MRLLSDKISPVPKALPGSGLLGSFIDFLLPPVCTLCEGALSSGPLCAECSTAFDSLRLTGPICVVCGDGFASEAGPDRTCGRCRVKAPPFAMARSAFTYNGPILDTVHRFKYGGAVALAAPLGHVMADYAVESWLKPDVVVPVPMHFKRLKMRGFNQSLLLARVMGKRLGARLDYLSLKRTAPTKPQAGLKAADRQTNVRGAFRLLNPSAFKYTRVLLVDDVYTTGATAAECSRVLNKAGAEVYVITLARAVR